MNDRVELQITAGPGGPEAEDFAAMILCAYLRWFAKRGFVVSSGQATELEAVTQTTLTVTGQNIRELLRGEEGKHCLIRESPFDPLHRQHTTYVLVRLDPQGSEVRWPPRPFRIYSLSGPNPVIFDWRTGYQTMDIKSVCDGNLDGFIEAASAPSPFAPHPA